MKHLNLELEKLEQRIADVVVAKQKSGVGYQNDLGGVVRFASRPLPECDRFD